MTGPPYGATVPGVRALVLDVAAEGLRPNNRASRTPDPQVEEWIDNAGAIVDLRLARLALLPVDTTDPGWVAGDVTQAAVELQARHLVELYAASLVADVTHPERALNGKGFGAVLMARFTADLAALAKDVDDAVERQTADGGSAINAPRPLGYGLDERQAFGAGLPYYGPTGRPTVRGF
jgi:hypothetical protein